MVSTTLGTKLKLLMLPVTPWMTLLLTLCLSSSSLYSSALFSLQLFEYAFSSQPEGCLKCCLNRHNPLTRSPVCFSDLSSELTSLGILSLLLLIPVNQFSLYIFSWLHVLFLSGLSKNVMLFVFWLFHWYLCSHWTVCSWRQWWSDLLTIVPSVLSSMPSTE